jgi:hypothetical protein
MRRLGEAGRHQLVDDEFRVVAAERLELLRDLLIGDEGVVRGLALHQRRQSPPDHTDHGEKRQRDRKQDAPGEAVAAAEHPATDVQRLRFG